MPQNEREKFFEWAASIGMTRRIATRLLKHLPDEGPYDPLLPNWICSPAYCLSANHPAGHGTGIEERLISNGFLVIGSCPNGDSVLVNFRDPKLPVFYLSHELQDYVDYTFDAKMTRKISDSITDYEKALSREDSDVPLDFFG